MWGDCKLYNMTYYSTPYFIIIVVFYSARGDRYDAVRMCLGEDTLQKLSCLKLFMVSMRGDSDICEAKVD